MRDAAEREVGRPYGRRAFLGLITGGVSSLWWGQSAWQGVAKLVRPASRVLPSDVRAALPSPTAGWRIYTVNPPMPRFHPATWRLTLDGLVERPQSFTIEDLRRLPRAEQRSDFHCVTGWSVPGVTWAGVRFGDLLRVAGPQGGAGALLFVSAERPYTDSLSLTQALQSDAMLAYEMDGRPLAREHGAPLRVVMPQMYGYKNVKWVNQITVTARPQTGFWEERGYDRDAWVGRSNGYYD
jgi:DMSO/TMAO reductase YedYZ molybdopterin-dependent catalytic subunit